jgi:hypothetical protein
MMALAAALVAVVFYYYINRREFKLERAMKDAAFLTMILSLAIFAWLAWTESGTLIARDWMRPLWLLEWGAFRDLLWSFSAAMLLLFLSLYVEYVEPLVDRFRRLRLQSSTPPRLIRPRQTGAKNFYTGKAGCGITWREAEASLEASGEAGGEEEGEGDAGGGG